MSPITANSAFSGAGASFVALQPSRIIVEEATSAWINPVKRRLQELTLLPKGWDGYRGNPVLFDNAHFALLMLKRICPETTPAPQIVPGPDGDLQVEWHTANRSLELHVKAPNEVVAWFSSPDQPHGIELELTNDFLPVLDWVNQVLGEVTGVDAAAA
ncbi:hypothetical protein HNQ36_000473 [Afipia massiliensis]|uniref:Uncharacterized protein n=1 Tax=Afipia massiliensis TaxID=211460 RepID=A0A840MRV0_9BRAD|nr:hypothetical protein [Afipia massiliensis]MBB5050525.1 hypothetical protein [Afipia massiliensis]